MHIYTYIYIYPWFLINYYVVKQKSDKFLLDICSIDHLAIIRNQIWIAVLLFYSNFKIMVSISLRLKVILNKIHSKCLKWW